LEHPGQLGDPLAASALLTNYMKTVNLYRKREREEAQKRKRDGKERASVSTSSSFPLPPFLFSR